MKIFKKQNKGPILNKADIFTGKVQEHFEPIEGRLHATQGYIRGVIEGKNSPLQLTKYHLIKKFKNNTKQKKELTAYNQQKTTKYLRKLSQIYYFTVLTKKIFYLTATLKKIKKNIKIWIKQLIQNEIYYLKKALILAKNKEQIVQIYLKFKKNIKIYKKLHLKYLKATYIQYLKILKKHKRYWDRMLIHGFTKKKYYKKRARILPFIMFLKRRLFKKLRTGTHRNIRYWRKLIRKFAKRYSILQENDTEFITSDKYPISTTRVNIKEVLNENVNQSIKPYLLLKYIISLRTKSRTELFNKIRKLYYNILVAKKLKTYTPRANTKIKKNKMQLLVYKKAKLLWKKTKAQKLSKLSRFCALAMRKKKYIYNIGYLKRRGASATSRLIEKKIVPHNMKEYKEDIVSKVMLAGKVSMWFVLFKNWNRMSYVKLLKQIIKKSDISRKFKKKSIKHIVKQQYKKKKIKLLKLFKTKNKKKARFLALLVLRGKIRQLLRKLCAILPTQVRKNMIDSILKKIIKIKKKFKSKTIKRKLIRILRRKKKGETRRKKRRKFKQKRFKFKKFRRKRKKSRKYKKKKMKNRKRPGMRRVVKKSKKLRRRLRWKLKRRIRKFLRRGGKKYKNTAFLFQDYSAHWIDNLRRKTKFKKKKGKRSILTVAAKVRTWKMRRFLRKNYRESMNARFYMAIRHKEIANVATQMFMPENV